MTNATASVQHEARTLWVEATTPPHEPEGTHPAPGESSPAPHEASPAAAHRSRSVLRQWGGGWLHVAMHVCGLPLSVVSYGFLLLVVGILAVVPVFLLGVPLLAGWLGVAHFSTRADRAILQAFTGADLPPRTALTRAPVGSSFLQKLKHRFMQVDAWKAVAYRVFFTLWAFLMGVIFTSLTAWGLYALLSPLLRRFATPEGIPAMVMNLRLNTDLRYALMVAAGLVLVIVLPFLARGATYVNVLVARALISDDPEKRLRDLSKRVDTLTDTRDKVLTSVEDERRRIERDLHDGPQQRLVAAAMEIGVARTLVSSDQPDLKAALDRAHSNAKEAIVDMRHVARGIAPPILTDRGLSAALSALGARTSVPVTITVDVAERLDSTIEAVAYFVVSESLTNVTKHARARSASVDVTHQGTVLIVTVSDNGIGNANPSGGTGLVGLKQRVAAVDGTLTVSSPDGGPTVVTATIPLHGARR